MAIPRRIRTRLNALPRKKFMIARVLLEFAKRVRNEHDYDVLVAETETGVSAIENLFKRGSK